MLKVWLSAFAFVCFVGLAVADRHSHWGWLLGAGLAFLTAAFAVKWLPNRRV